MKKNILALLIIFVLIIPVFTGCQEETGLTKEERIEAFVKDLNNPLRSGIYKKHFNTTSTLHNLPDLTSITLFPVAVQPQLYSVESIKSTLLSSILTVIIKGPFDSSTKETFTFTMKNEGNTGKDDWYIFLIVP